MDFLETAKAIMWLGLAVLFAVGGIGFGYAMWRTGRILRRAELDLHRTVDGIVPIIVKAGVSMDQVNQQLGKVDVMLDSAVDMTDSLDTTVRAVSHAITEPVRVVSSAAAGAAETVRSFHERVTGERTGDPAAGAAARTDARDGAATATTTAVNVGTPSERGSAETLDEQLHVGDTE